MVCSPTSFEVRKFSSTMTEKMIRYELIRKSRKMNKYVQYDQSSLFKGNETDHRQFQDIYKTIEESQIIKTFGISHDINKAIAEFATGNWEECQHCCELVSILYQNKGGYSCPGCERTLKFFPCKQCNHNFLLSVHLHLHDGRRGYCEKCGDYICNSCAKECSGCGDNVCNDCFEPCKDCDNIDCEECNGRCETCFVIPNGGNPPICYRCVYECTRCGGLRCRDHCGVEWCYCCRGSKCDSCNNVIGLCAICGETVCADCIKIGETDSKNEIKMNVKCVCEKCCDRYKDIFKHL